MARLATLAPQLQHQHANGLLARATGATYVADPVTGRIAFRFNATAASFYEEYTLTGAALDRNYYLRAYCYFVSWPSSSIAYPLNFAQGVSNFASFYVNTTGVPTLQDTQGDSSVGTALSLSVRYRFEFRIKFTSASTDEIELRIYAGDSTTPLQTLGPLANRAIANAAPTLFRFGGEATGTYDWYMSEVVLNDDQGASENSWPGPGYVVALRPTGAGTAGTAEANWTKPGGATTTKETAVDNAPPVYLADSTSAADAEKMLRNATNASSDTTHALTTYTAAGVGQYDIIRTVQPLAITGSSSATDTTGTLGMPSNPTISQASLTTYDNGIASATATTWLRQLGTVTYDPTVAKSTAPEIRLNRAAAARTVMVNALAAIIEVEPVALPELVMAPMRPGGR